MKNTMYDLLTHCYDQPGKDSYCRKSSAEDISQDGGERQQGEDDENKGRKKHRILNHQW